jgi:hypothetical protein
MSIKLKPPLLDLERRRPVWLAMSELFLDTELNDERLQTLAARLKTSGYCVHELDTILRREVSPILGGNLVAVTGAWDVFDDAWLVEQIAARQRSWKRWIPSYFGFHGYRMIKGDWDRVQEMILRGSSEPRCPECGERI